MNIVVIYVEGLLDLIQMVVLLGINQGNAEISEVVKVVNVFQDMVSSIKEMG